jgi:hypothetical protein
MPTQFFFKYVFEQNTPLPTRTDTHFFANFPLISPSRHTYRNPLSETRTWESSQRLTRPKNSDIDGVGITAILQPKDGPPLILLQKQFRPPIDKVCIEVPAGLMDEGETAEECALRELKEETGYIGEVVKGDFGIGPMIWNGRVPIIGVFRLPLSNPY